MIQAGIEKALSDLLNYENDPSLIETQINRLRGEVEKEPVVDNTYLHLQKNLLDVATSSPNAFQATTRRIDPTQQSLFEVYETLGEEPQKWRSFLLSELERHLHNVHNKNTTQYAESVGEALFGMYKAAEQDETFRSKACKHLFERAERGPRLMTRLCIQLIERITPDDCPEKKRNLQKNEEISKSPRLENTRTDRNVHQLPFRQAPEKRPAHHRQNPQLHP